VCAFRLLDPHQAFLDELYAMESDEAARRAIASMSDEDVDSWWSWADDEAAMNLRDAERGDRRRAGPPPKETSENEDSDEYAEDLWLYYETPKYSTVVASLRRSLEEDVMRGRTTRRTRRNPIPVEFGVQNDTPFIKCVRAIAYHGECPDAEWNRLTDGERTRIMRRAGDQASAKKYLRELLEGVMSTHRRAGRGSARSNPRGRFDAYEVCVDCFLDADIQGEETDTFSRSSCDECGTTLGGPRYSIFKEREGADAPRRRPVARKNPRTHPGDLDRCTRQYLETALWSSTGDDGEPIDDYFDISDFAPEAVAEARRVCDEFQARNDTRELDSEQIGHYLWLSRNGHGAGFFDIDRHDLQDAARRLGERWPYVGDDGLIYFG